MLGLRSPLTFAFTALLLSACSETSQITVEVDHTQRPPGASVEITVRRAGGDTEVFREQSPAEWPVSLAIVPKDDDISGVVVATAKVTLDGEEFTQEARSPFRRGENVVLRMEFGERIHRPDAGPESDGGLETDGGSGADAGLETDAGQPDDCGFVGAPGDPTEPLRAQAVVGHSMREGATLRHRLLVSTQSELVLFHQRDGSPGCFDPVTSIPAPDVGWGQHIDLGWDGRHLIIVAATEGSASEANIFATFAEPGSSFPVPERVLEGRATNVIAGGNSGPTPLLTPYIAAAFDARFELAHWTDSGWQNDQESTPEATDFAGLPGHLIVAGATSDASTPRLSAQRIRWNGSTSVRTPTEIGPDHTFVAAGRTEPMVGGLPGGTPWVVATSPDDRILHRYRRNAAAWMEWGSTEVGRLVEESHQLLDANHTHWLAVVSGPDGLTAAWGDIRTAEFQRTPIEDVSDASSLSIAVFPFGFVHVTDDRTLRVHVQTTTD